MFIYFGYHDKDTKVCKIGQTVRSCKARCQYDDYTIVCAVEYDDITRAQLTLLESAVRVFMELQGYTIVGMDYLTMPKRKRRETAVKDFLRSVKIANACLTLLTGQQPVIEMYQGDCMVYQY